MFSQFTSLHKLLQFSQVLTRLQKTVVPKSSQTFTSFDKSSPGWRQRCFGRVSAAFGPLGVPQGLPGMHLMTLQGSLASPRASPKMRQTTLQRAPMVPGMHSLGRRSHEAIIHNYPSKTLTKQFATCGQSAGRPQRQVGTEGAPTAHSLVGDRGCPHSP